MANYYYQITSYSIGDLSLNKPELPEGPFATSQEREDAFLAEAATRDFETSETPAVIFFKVDGDTLTLERSFIAGYEGDGQGVIPDEDGEG